jgi:hypothetical protein
MRTLLFFILFPALLSAQQIEVGIGGHFSRNFPRIEEASNLMLTVSGKQLYKNWGAYASMYSPNKRVGEFVVVSYADSSYLQQKDTFVFYNTFMPSGFSLGVNYSFKMGVSVHAGIGVSYFKRREFTEIYEKGYIPGRGYIQPISSTSTERIVNAGTKVCFELGADYDLLRKSAWAFGPRIGYNNQNGVSGQLLIGYNFKQKQKSPFRN